MRRTILGICFAFIVLMSSGAAVKAESFLPFRPIPWKIGYDDHHKTFIPKTKPIPRGWVVVGHRHSFMSFGGTCQQWIIQKLPASSGTYLTIYNQQEVPCGFAIVEEVHNCSCPGFGLNAYVIEKL